MAKDFAFCLLVCSMLGWRWTGVWSLWVAERVAGRWCGCWLCSSSGPWLRCKCWGTSCFWRFGLIAAVGAGVKKNTLADIDTIAIGARPSGLQWGCSQACGRNLDLQLVNGRKFSANRFVYFNFFVYHEVSQQQSQSNWFGSLVCSIIEMIGTGAPKNFRRHNTKHSKPVLDEHGRLLHTTMRREQPWPDLWCLWEGSVCSLRKIKGIFPKVFENSWSFDVLMWNNWWHQTINALVTHVWEVRATHSGWVCSSMLGNIFGNKIIWEQTVHQKCSPSFNP